METQIFTDEHGIDVTVHFDDLKYQHIEHIDHTNVYEARGYDANGRQYTGIASFTCDELDGITDIERIEQ
jgi:hypothetical protein